MNAFRWMRRRRVRRGRGARGGSGGRGGPARRRDRPCRLHVEKRAGPDGYWCYELEADATIPAEYVLMMHYTGEVDTDLEAKIGHYLRARQDDSGGWPLYPGRRPGRELHRQVYFALKLIGDDPQAPHMARAREAVLARAAAL